MTCVSRRRLPGLHLVSIIGVLLVGMLLCSTQALAAGEENTERADQIDGRKRMVSVVADGKSVPCIVTSQVTVEEQLNKLGITLEQLDTVTPPLEEIVREGDVIRVNRIRKQEVVERGVIPHDTIYNYSPDVLAGTEQVFVEGEDGYGSQTYEVTLVDGVETERVLLREAVEKEPITREVGTGFRSPLISPYNFDWQFNAAGEPVQTKQVLRDQRSSAYSAKRGAKTASGRDAVEGHVAVNPNVIPYGSKLFIQSRDGNYIYGYAIAADTGIALMDGRVDVDIFYDTYQESVNHGIRTVDIFVLE